MKKRSFWRYIIMGVLGIFLFNAARTIVDTYKAGNRVEVLEEEVLALKVEKGELEEEKQFRGDSFYVEQQARDSLNMAKPGDVVVLLQEKAPEVEQKSEPVVQVPIPAQWKKLLFDM